jgi:hypothetical protein
MWLIITTTSLGIAGSVLSLIASLKGTENRQLRRFLIFGVLIAILMLIVQGIQQGRSDVDHSKELSDARTQYETLKSQNDSLRTEVGGLTTKLSDAQAQIKEMTNPRLVFVESQTETNREDKTGQYLTQYHWTSKPVATIRNLSLKLRFDCALVHVHAALTPMLPFSGNGQVKMDSDHKGLLLQARLLQEGSDVVLSVRTDTPPKIVSSEVSP